MPADKDRPKTINGINMNRYDHLNVVDLKNNIEPSILTPDPKLPISHLNKRLFRPDKLSLPRDFKRPQFITNPAFIDSDTTSVANNLNLESNSNSNITETEGLKNVESPLSQRRPLIVEIGVGKGKHACLYAQQNPQHDMIAIERTANKFAAFEQLLNEAKLANLLAVHADAIPYSVFALPAHSVDTAFILYPNPEPKNPNQQWLNMPFFEFLLSRMKPGGKIVLASNIKDYIDNAYSKSIAIWQLTSQKYKVPSTSTRTHFEIKYLQRGEICWEIEMIKPAYYRTHFDTWQAVLE